MSLDVYLTGPEPTRSGTGIFVRERGSTREITREEWDERFPDLEPVVAEVARSEIYSANITHNLNEMADAAGIYQHLWRPEEIGITKAADLIEPLMAGLRRLRRDPDAFRKHNPPNGWGDYDGFVRFVEGYVTACRKHPETTVSVWR